MSLLIHSLLYLFIYSLIFFLTRNIKHLLNVENFSRNWELDDALSPQESDSLVSIADQ